MPIPLIAMAGMMAAQAAAQGLQAYSKSKQQAKEAKRNAIRGLYGQMAGRASPLMGIETPDDSNAFTQIAMPAAQATMSSLTSAPGDAAAKTTTKTATDAAAPAAAGAAASAVDKTEPTGPMPVAGDLPSGAPPPAGNANSSLAGAKFGQPSAMFGGQLTEEEKRRRMGYGGF